MCHCWSWVVCNNSNETSFKCNWSKKIASFYKRLQSEYWNSFPSLIVRFDSQAIVCVKSFVIWSVLWSPLVSNFISRWCFIFFIYCTDLTFFRHGGRYICWRCPAWPDENCCFERSQLPEKWRTLCYLNKGTLSVRMESVACIYENCICRSGSKIWVDGERHFCQFFFLLFIFDIFLYFSNL